MADKQNDTDDMEWLMNADLSDDMMEGGRRGSRRSSRPTGHTAQQLNPYAPVTAADLPSHENGNAQVQSNEPLQQQRPELRDPMREEPVHHAESMQHAPRMREHHSHQFVEQEAPRKSGGLIKILGIGAAVILLLAGGGFYAYDAGLFGDDSLPQTGNRQTSAGGISQPFPGQSPSDQQSLPFRQTEQAKKEHYWESALVSNAVAEEIPVEKRPTERKPATPPVMAPQMTATAIEPAAQETIVPDLETGDEAPSFAEQLANVEAEQAAGKAPQAVTDDSDGGMLALSTNKVGLLAESNAGAISTIDDRMEDIELLLQENATQMAGLNKRLDKMEKTKGSGGVPKDVTKRMKEIEKSLKVIRQSLGGFWMWTKKAEVRPGWKVVAATKKKAVIVGPDGEREHVRVGQVVSGSKILSIDPKSRVITTTFGVIKG